LNVSLTPSIDVSSFIYIQIFEFWSIYLGFIACDNISSIKTILNNEEP
jgi:hypothetical protein